MAAIGRVSRRAKTAEMMAATTSANAPVQNKKDPARPSGRVSTAWVSTNTGVRCCSLVERRRDEDGPVSFAALHLPVEQLLRLRDR